MSLAKDAAYSVEKMQEALRKLPDDKLKKLIRRTDRGGPIDSKIVGHYGDEKSYFGDILSNARRLYEQRKRLTNLNLHAGLEQGRRDIYAIGKKLEEENSKARRKLALLAAGTAGAAAAAYGAGKFYDWYMRRKKEKERANESSQGSN